MNVYRWARCGRSKRPNHGRRHSGQRWTWGVSAAIAVLSWALRRFRQMDTVPSSLKLQGTPPWGGSISKRVFLSEPGQINCTAVDLSRQNSCPSVSILYEPLLAEPN